jgi:hypothetical protein
MRSDTGPFHQARRRLGRLNLKRSEVRPHGTLCLFEGVEIVHMVIT